jgi:serine/threonine protein phosphatase PrpC
MTNHVFTTPGRTAEPLPIDTPPEAKRKPENPLRQMLLVGTALPCRDAKHRRPMADPNPPRTTPAENTRKAGFAVTQPAISGTFAEVDPVPLQVATTSASFRSASEDRLAVHHVPDGLVVVVADGAGGIPGGGLAADLVLVQVERAVTRKSFEPYVSSSWIDLLSLVDMAAEQDRAAGETTAVVVAVTDSGLVVGASCGDSGALLVRKDGTVDDLTQDQHRKKRLGSGSAVPVGFDRPTLDGTLVVASDGLLGYARPNVVAEVVLATENVDEAASSLVARVRLPSGSLMDDVTIVLVRD